jgi:hypothetical protein
MVLDIYILLQANFVHATLILCLPWYAYPMNNMAGFDSYIYGLVLLWKR